MSGQYEDPRPENVNALLDALDDALRAGQVGHFRVVPTGFAAFDRAIGGGLRRGDLAVVAGPPGVGKTVFALQLARHVAARRRPAVVVSYEHDQTAMVLRLLAQEAGRIDSRGAALAELSARLKAAGEDHDGLAELLRGRPDLQKAVLELSAIGDHLVLLGGALRDVGLEALEDLAREVEEEHGDTPVLVVDYLQKVPMPDDGDPSRAVVQGLKDLALRRDLPVVAIASLSVEGLLARRLRLAHLGPSSAIAFEADLVVMMAPKRDTVAKAHLAYGGAATREFDDWVVWTLEKNRGGPTRVNLEFRKDFAHFRFDPSGRTLAERLADERIGGDYG